MYNFSVVMGLADYIPVLFFGAAAVLLQRDLYPKMRKDAFALFAAGTINIFAAGFLKATWKLLYGAGVCDFQALNSLFLPLQSIGFLLAGFGMILMVSTTPSRKSSSAAALAAVPPVFSGSFIFIMMMVLGLGSICTCLSILAARLKKKWVIALFALAFICSMCMGYMASKDSTQSWVNWVEQGINTVSQGALLAGVIILHKSGLKEQLS